MTPLEALQKTLSGEHAAVHLYGLLGAQASESRQPALYRRLVAAFESHRDARDRLTVLISARGNDPVAAEADYDAPGPVSTPAQVQAVARTIERRVTRTYAELVANTSGNDRRRAISELDASAVRQLGFGVAPSNFPGLG